MLRSTVRRTAQLLCAVATGSAVLLAAAPAASADLTCAKGQPTTPGTVLPCASPAPGLSPAMTKNLGRKLA